jgi:hypothetical protein
LGSAIKTETKKKVSFNLGPQLWFCLVHNFDRFIIYYFVSIALRCIALQYCHANSKIHFSIFNFTEATPLTCYVRKAKEPYTAACPANNAEMFRDSQIDSASMDEQRKEQTKNKILKDLIAIQSQDEEGLFEVLDGFMGNGNARMVPKILEIIRRKKSAAPALSEEQRNEQRWQHLRKNCRL